MWFQRLRRYIRGEVRFRAEGGLCEHFLNLVAEGVPPIRLWDMEVADGVVTASCCAADYGRLRPFARRTGTRVRSVSYHGLFKTARPLRRRPGYLVGALLATAVYMWLGARIWVLDVTAADETIRDTVIQVLAEGGIDYGCAVRQVDLDAVRMKVIAQIPQVHHVSIYIDGCVVKAAVTPADESVTPPDDIPTNLVAERDGLIVSMRVSQGEKIVKVGEAVVAGDLLVCGVTETTKGVLLHHSQAVVMAQTEHRFKVSASRQETVIEDGRRIVCPTVQVFSLYLPLYASGAAVDGWDTAYEQRALTLFGVSLPLSIRTVRYTEPIETVVTYTDEEVTMLANERLRQAMAEELTEVDVTDMVIEGVWEGDTYRLTATVTVIEDIAVEQRLLFKTE